jgi:predicted small lipoprotein YifL
MLSRLLLVLLLLMPVSLAGCQARGPAPIPPAAASQPYHCLLPSEQRMLVAELFFGRAIPGRGPLTEAEWAAFAADTITPNFPNGFTVFDGDGQWQNPATGRIGRERTKILLVAARRDPTLAGRLQAVIDAYKVRFHQQSVGTVTRDSCAAF